MFWTDGCYDNIFYHELIPGGNFFWGPLNWNDKIRWSITSGNQCLGLLLLEYWRWRTITSWWNNVQYWFMTDCCVSLFGHDLIPVGNRFYNWSIGIIMIDDLWFASDCLVIKNDPSRMIRGWKKRQFGTSREGFLTRAWHQWVGNIHLVSQNARLQNRFSPTSRSTFATPIRTAPPSIVARLILTYLLRTDSLVYVNIYSCVNDILIACTYHAHPSSLVT